MEQLHHTYVSSELVAQNNMQQTSLIVLFIININVIGMLLGETCDPERDQPHGITDRFDNMYGPQQHWQSIAGGRLGNGCGVLADGNSLYFDGEGAREARTVPLNTTAIMYEYFFIF